LAAEIQNTQSQNTDLTPIEKTEIILSQVSLSTLYLTFFTERQLLGVPDIITPSAIIEADPTISATNFKEAGFQPIEIYGLYPTRELLDSGYTIIPKYPAALVGNSFASFNNKF